MPQRDVLTREDAQQRATVIRRPQYTSSVDVTDPARYTMTTEVRFDATAGADSFIDLAADEVLEATLNGQPIDLALYADSRLPLRALAEHNTLRVVARRTYADDGKGLTRFVDPEDGEAYLHTQGEHFYAHHYMACFDQPDIKGTMALDITVPTGWKAVSNMAVARKDPAANGAAERWTFGTTPVLSTYLAALTAGPFHEVTDSHNGLPLSWYARKSMAQYLNAPELFSLTKDALDILAARFGQPYPFLDGADAQFAHYAQVVVPGFQAGAMENFGCVTYAESMLPRGQMTPRQRSWILSTPLHEMVHMWFGDLVTMEWWDDLWLNESFATYNATRTAAGMFPELAPWVAFHMDKQAGIAEDELPTTHPVATPVTATDRGWENFDRITYQKGAAVVRQLAAVLGQEKFDEGVRAYLRNRRFGNATLADFLGALEVASGRSLQQWAKDWLQTAGTNVLRPHMAEAGGVITGFAVLQEAAVAAQPTLRLHKVQVGLYDLKNGKLVRRSSTPVEVSGARTEVPALVGQPTADLVLVNDEDLTFAKMDLDPRSLQTVLDHYGALEDPLARALSATSLWHLTRDAKLPAREYVRWVVRQVRDETDAATVEDLLSRADTAITRFADASVRDSLRGELAVLAKERMGSAPANQQTTWVRTRVRSLLARDTPPAAGSAEVTEVRALASGTTDTALRWFALTNLARAGALSESELEAAAKADPQSWKEALTAHAAMPTAAAKEWAWKQLLEGGGTPQSRSIEGLRAVVNGFAQPTQEALLEAYIGRYADMVEKVSRSRTEVEVATLVQGLFPLEVSERVVTVARTAQGRATASPPAARYLVQLADSTERAMRARQRDAAGLPSPGAPRTVGLAGG